MINWIGVASNGIWLLGLALILAGAGLADFRGWTGNMRWRVSWQSSLSSAWSRSGSLLFTMGMALSAGSLVESLLWGLIGLYVVWSWLQSRKKGDSSSHAVGDDTPIGDGLDVEPERDRSKSRVERASRWRSVRRIAEWVASFDLLWLALVSPFLLFPAPDRIWVLLALPLLWIIRWVGCGYFVPRTPLDWPILVMLCMVLVSLWATFDINQSLSHITTLLLSIALFYSIVEWGRSSRRLALGAAAYALAGGALVTVGLLATQWPATTPFLGTLTAHLPALLRGLSTNPEGFNPNIIAGTLVLLAPFQLSLLWWSFSGGNAWTRLRWVIGLGLAVLSAASLALLVLTRTRGALLGLAVGIGLMLLLGGKRARYLFLAGLLVAVAGLGYFALDKSVGTQDLLAELFGSKADPASAIQTLSSREEIWARAIFGIEDFPLTGMGMNTFRRVMPVLYPSFTLAPDADVGHAHNQFLTVALDLGLPGLISYMAVWLGAVAMLVQAWKQRPGIRDQGSGIKGNNTQYEWQRATLVGLAGALTASFVYGLTDALVLGAKGSFIFWALLGLVVVFWRQLQEAEAGVTI